MRLIIAASATKDSLPAGKLNVVWRQGRAGYVVTVSRKDLAGVSAEFSIERAIRAAEDAYNDHDGRLDDLRERIRQENA